GSHDRHKDESIPPHYFDLPRNLGFEDNSIATDLAAIVDDPRWQRQFDAEREHKPLPWFNVRVEAQWLLGWFASQMEEMEDTTAAFEYVEPFMLEPMMADGTAGLVPLGVVIAWIMTKAGTQRVRLDDQEAWAAAVAELLPFLADETFKVRGFSETADNDVPSSIFALIDILSPLDM